jgi:hypothetical protein
MLHVNAVIICKLLLPVVITRHLYLFLLHSHAFLPSPDIFPYSRTDLFVIYKIYISSLLHGMYFPCEVIGFFNRLNPSSRTMALWSTQPLTETSTRNLPEGKRRPARKADSVTAICEPIV